MSAFGHATVPVACFSLYRQNRDNANRQAEHAEAPPTVWSGPRNLS